VLFLLCVVMCLPKDHMDSPTLMPAALPAWLLVGLTEIAKALAAAQPPTPPTPQTLTFSANQAARKARVRRSLVSAAIASGALPATKRGLRRFTITQAALDGWIATGCPEAL
jgi:hypothetical protein